MNKYKKFMRVVSYLAVFNLGSWMSATMATYLINNDAYPDIELGWKSLVTPMINLAALASCIYLIKKEEEEEKSVAIEEELSS